MNSGVYEKELKKIRGDVEVYSNSCPLFVPLVEEGMIEDEVTDMMIERYLEPFKGSVDSLILGCTHYPLLEEVIRRYLRGTGVEVVNPAIEVAQELKALLEGRGQLSEEIVSRDEFYVSDSPNHFRELGEMFLGSEIEEVQKINLEEYWRG